MNKTQNDSVVIFSRAALMLAEADTIQKAKELKDLALTAKDFARRKGMGGDAIQHCRSYALRAEIRLGELLAMTERAKPPNPKPPKDRRSHNVTDDAPTLALLGISKRESAEAQALAALPKPKQEAIIAGELTRTAARREKEREYGNSFD